MQFLLFIRYTLVILTCYLMVHTIPLHSEQWANPIQLSLSGQNASSPQIAIDPFGNAIAVWCRFDGRHSIIQASSKSAGGNWQTIPDNLSLPSQDAFNPQIAIDFIGNVTVVWEQFNGNHSIIQATTKLVGNHWQNQPDNLSLFGQSAYSPRLAIDSMGHATVVWHCYHGSHSIVQSSTKQFGRNWQTIPDILSLSGWSAKNAQIVMDSYDNMIIVWQASNGIEEVIQATTRLFQDDWQSIPDTLSLPAKSNSYPQLAVDSLGNVTVVWNQFNGQYGTIQASTKIFGSDWQITADTLSLPGQNTFSPKVTADLMGNLTVVWEAFDAKKLKGIQASTKLFGMNWQSVPDNLSSSGYNNVNPQIAVDSFGRMVVVWNHCPGFKHIQISRKDSGSNWQAAPEIISLPSRNTFSPHIALGGRGEVIVVWIAQDGFSLIQCVAK